MTAYLVNESRARCPGLARDWLAAHWIPAHRRDAVRQLWAEFAGTVYAHDDLVVSLRGRCVLDALGRELSRHPDAQLVVCGAGFSSYPWLLPFRSSIEIDLPEIVEAKRRRTGQLRAAGVIGQQDVTYLAADLTDGRAWRQLIARVRSLTAGHPVAVVAEGLVFYLPPPAARAVMGLGTALGPGTLSILSYWPADAAGSPVLAAQRRWFRRHAVPDAATYLTDGELRDALGQDADIHGPEKLQRQYLGEVKVPERELIPEHVAVTRP